MSRAPPRKPARPPWNAVPGGPRRRRRPPAPRPVRARPREPAPTPPGSRAARQPPAARSPSRRGPRPGRGHPAQVRGDGGLVPSTAHAHIGPACIPRGVAQHADALDRGSGVGVVPGIGGPVEAGVPGFAGSASARPGRQRAAPRAGGVGHAGGQQDARQAPRPEASGASRGGAASYYTLLGRAAAAGGGNRNQSEADRGEFDPDRNQFPIPATEPVLLPDGLPRTLAAAIRELGARPRKERLWPVIADLCALRAWAPHQLARVLPVTSPKMLVHRHLSPMVEAGLLERTHPESPNHPEQAYRTRSRSES